MRTYGIRKRTDNRLVYHTTSRHNALYMLNNFFNRTDYKLVILRRG